MAAALVTAGVVLLVLLWELYRPTLGRARARVRDAWQARRRASETSGL